MAEDASDRSKTRRRDGSVSLVSVLVVSMAIVVICLSAGAGLVAGGDDGPGATSESSGIDRIVELTETETPPTTETTTDAADAAIPETATPAATTEREPRVLSPAQARAQGYVDRDEDGVADDLERRLGTDRSRADTDGDGIPDGTELTCGRLFPDADPLHQDVYLEIDAETGESLSDETIDQVEQSFAAAPVDNPDGESGMTVHARPDDRGLDLGDPVDSDRREGPMNDIYEVTDAHRDLGDQGHYYVLVADSVAYSGEDRYVGAGRSGLVMLEPNDRTDLSASLLVHELGHAFGMGEQIDGVDDEQYSLGEYPSVMNYNGLYEIQSYSDGSGDLGRDEWSFVAEDRYRPSVDCGPTGVVVDHPAA